MVELTEVGRRLILRQSLRSGWRTGSDSRGCATPHGRQTGERAAVSVELRRRNGGGVGEAICAGEIAKQVVEAAVLRVDDDDVTYLSQTLTTILALTVASLLPCDAVARR